MGIVGLRPASLFNLLVEFDAQGVVERSRVIADGDLNRELAVWWKQAGRVPGNPVPTVGLMKVRCFLNGVPMNATLEGREGFLILRSSSAASCDSGRTVINEILRIATLPGDSHDPEFMTLRILYRDGLDPPESIQLQLTPSDCYRLLTYAASAEAFIPAPWLSAPVLVSPDQGAVFSSFPRTTTVRWTASPGAIAYIVQWDYTSDGGWSSDNRELPDFEILVPGPTYTFDFVGPQAGRWRVWPVTAEGLRGNPSEWRTFRYTR